ncbi:MAG: hypothetical protein ABR577_07995 [Pyrinomonadaceae bacterium]
MHTALHAALGQVYTPPAYFGLPLIILLLGGAIGSLVAAVLGFSRARAYGVSTRWFALAFVCLFIYHLQWAVAVFALVQNDSSLAFSVFSFINLFVMLAVICGIVGFVRLTDSR